MSIILIMRGFRQCKSCGCCLSKNAFDEGYCIDCVPGIPHKCFFCNSTRNIRKVRHKSFGLTWCCRWCKRKEDDFI